MKEHIKSCKMVTRSLQYRSAHWANQQSALKNGTYQGIALLVVITITLASYILHRNWNENVDSKICTYRRSCSCFLPQCAQVVVQMTISKFCQKHWKTHCDQSSIVKECESPKEKCFIQNSAYCSAFTFHVLSFPMHELVTM